LCGAALFYYAWAVPYPIRDMNGDGEIDWKDYDMNGDGKVDMRDIVQVGVAYGSEAGDSRFNPRCDFNGDGVVNYPTLKGGASMQRMVKGWFTSAPSKGI